MQNAACAVPLPFFRARLGYSWSIEADSAVDDALHPAIQCEVNFSFREAVNQAAPHGNSTIHGPLG